MQVETSVIFLYGQRSFCLCYNENYQSGPELKYYFVKVDKVAYNTLIIYVIRRSAKN